MDVTSQVKVKLDRQKGENFQYGIAGCDYSLGWNVLKVECKRTEHHHLSHVVYWRSLTKTWVDLWCLPLPWEWPVNSPLQLLRLKWKDILFCSFLITSHTEWPLSRCLTFMFIMMTTVQVLVVRRLDDSTVCFTITYLLDNDLSAGYCYLPLTELGPDLWFLKSNYLTFDPKCRALGRLTNTGKTVLLEMCTHGLCHAYCSCTLPLSKWGRGHPTSRQKCCHKSLHPLHPTIKMHIIHTVLYKFPTYMKFSTMSHSMFWWMF